MYWSLNNLLFILTNIFVLVDVISVKTVPTIDKFRGKAFLKFLLVVHIASSSILFFLIHNLVGYQIQSSLETLRRSLKNLAWPPPKEIFLSTTMRSSTSSCLLGFFSSFRAPCHASSSILVFSLTKIYLASWKLFRYLQNLTWPPGKYIFL